MNNKKETSILNFISGKKGSDRTIGGIASNFCYVYSSTMIHDISDELSSDSSITAVGVVDEQDRAIGIISRKELFNILGKPYGRDLHKKRDAGYVMSTTGLYHHSENIFSVAEDLSDSLYLKKTLYFIIFDDAGKFTGIFSNRDLLIYLSDITKRDIALAKQLQTCIVSEEKNMAGESFEITGASRMARGIGGDFYSIINYSEKRWLISICDVSGKGVPAALMSVTLGGMESMYNFDEGVRNYISRLNRYICETFSGQLFITGIFIDLDENTGKACIYNFGHSYFYILRDGDIGELKNRTGTIPMGVMKGTETSGTSLRMKPGDILVMITDGIEEQKNPEGEAYGTNRMLSIVKRNSNEPLVSIKELIYDDISSFQGSQAQNDDMSIILLRYRG